MFGAPLEGLDRAICANYTPPRHVIKDLPHPPSDEQAADWIRHLLANLAVAADTTVGNRSDDLCQRFKIGLQAELPSL